MVVMLPCCRPDRRQRVQDGVGTVPVNGWTPDTLSVALTLSLHGTRHVHTSSRAESVALPLQLATPRTLIKCLGGGS
jgi:hypothetical protein